MYKHKKVWLVRDLFMMSKKEYIFTIDAIENHDWDSLGIKNVADWKIYTVDPIVRIVL